MSNYTEFEEEFLVAAYLITEASGEPIIEVADILERYRIDSKPQWIMRALSGFKESGFTQGNLTMGPPETQLVYLNAYGVKEAERLMEQVGVRVSTHEQAAKIDEILGRSPPVSLIAPASDRIVRFDHNEPEFYQISEGLKIIRETIRSDNELGSEERSRIETGLEAASTLWQATELKAIQVKIGILMAAEDAAKALKDTAKAVMAALLVDTIKAFVKSQTGIDLDAL